MHGALPPPAREAAPAAGRVRKATKRKMGEYKTAADEVGEGQMGEGQMGEDRALRAALLGLTDGVILLDLGLRLILCNRAARRRLGWVGAPPRRGLALAAVLDRAGALDAAERAVIREHCAALLAGDMAPASGADCAAAEKDLAFGDFALRLCRLDGQGVMLSIPTGGDDGAAALRDPLTGLGNRRAFQAALAAALTGAEAEAALLLLDLDRFKHVNDSLGHPVGDALLRVVAQRLRASLRAGDILVRLGGDEFAILLPRADGAERLAERLVDLLGRPYLVEGHLANIGVSIGIARVPADAAEGGMLLRRADLALYAAKAAGRRQFAVFRPEMDTRAQARQALETDLRRAVALGQFHLHYQPLLDVASGAVIGFEALLRWEHPARGMVSPAEFIPLAEEVGLIVPIGEWVLRQALRTAANWPETILVAVNVSPVQFADGARLLSAVDEALAGAGLPGARLEVEITESVLLRDAAETLAILHDLRARGVRIAMDDFGTGYSSLSQLRSFPFDKIKIDRSFVSAIESENGGKAVVRAITALGASLGMTVTVEGVETEAQAAFVAASGGHQMQGYLISRPVSPEGVAALLARPPVPARQCPPNRAANGA